MAVGFQPTSSAQVNTKAGTLAMVLRNALRDIVTFKTWLDSQSDAQLTALGFATAEITLLRASFTDLKKLNDIANAAATQSATSNFWFNAINLLGVE